VERVGVRIIELWVDDVLLKKYRRIL